MQSMRKKEKKNLPLLSFYSIFLFLAATMLFIHSNTTF